MTISLPVNIGVPLIGALANGSQGTIETDSVAMARLATSDFPDILEDFLEISRKRRDNPTAIARLQIHMLEELMVQESAAKRYRNNLSTLEEKWKPPIPDSPLPEDITFAKQQLFF